MNRQEQVEVIMKNTLKTYFKKKEITKEEYKYILKKAVPQVKQHHCFNNNFCRFVLYKYGKRRMIYVRGLSKDLRIFT